MGIGPGGRITLPGEKVGLGSGVELGVGGRGVGEGDGTGVSVGDGAGEAWTVAVGVCGEDDAASSFAQPATRRMTRVTAMSLNILPFRTKQTPSS